jgi:hypothetical protein
MSAEINKRKIGVPLFTFDWQGTQPIDLDFVDLSNPSTDMVVENVSLVSEATSYGAGVSMMINNSAYAWPLYKISQDPSVPNPIIFDNPLIVSELESTGNFIAVKVNNSMYGVPLYQYHTVYPFTSTSLPMSAMPLPITLLRYGRLNDVTEKIPSTNLNSKIKTYSQLIQRIKTQLGYPFVNIEVCDDAQICGFIDIAMEWYTKYAGFTEEFLIFSSSMYQEPGLRIDKLFSITPSMRATYTNGMSASWDYDLGAYRKVVGLLSFDPGESTGINTLFTLEQSMAQQTYFSYMLGNAGFDLVTWECLKEWLDLREKVLAQKYYVDFDQYNQTLRLIPPPNTNSAFYGVVGAWLEKPVIQLISEQWVQKYALALTKCAVGNVRGKYQGMQMFGGGTINYNDLMSQGLKEKDELEASLRTGEWGETAPPRFFIG